MGTNFGLRLGFAQDPVAIMVLDRHQRRDFVQRPIEVQCCLRDHDQPIVQAVLRKNLAEAVEDSAPRRRQKLHVDAVLVGENLIALGVDDLEVIETPGKAGRQQRLCAAHDKGAAREQVGAFRSQPRILLGPRGGEHAEGTEEHDEEREEQHLVSTTCTTIGAAAVSARRNRQSRSSS